MDNAMYTKEIAIKFIKNEAATSGLCNDDIKRTINHFLFSLKDVDYSTSHYISDVYALLLSESEKLLKANDTPSDHLKRLECIVMITKIIRDSERFTIL